MIYVLQCDHAATKVRQESIVTIEVVRLKVRDRICRVKYTFRITIIRVVACYSQSTLE